MTEQFSWTPWPEWRTHLPEGGKVTGTFKVCFQGDGNVYAGTEGAHVNDNNPAIDYRGESFLVSLHPKRQEDGTFECDRQYIHVTRRQNWSDAPPSFRDAIVKAVCEHVASLWSEDLERFGNDSRARQRLASLQREEEELKGKLAEVRKGIRSEVKDTIPVPEMGTRDVCKYDGCGLEVEYIGVGSHYGRTQRGYGLGWQDRGGNVFCADTERPHLPA